uniref:Uncharacterized protein n=1 Tax=Amphimedon queenslandica TaxID=400682 RepID=A0A1X7TC11_AMPQE
MLLHPWTTKCREISSQSLTLLEILVCISHLICRGLITFPSLLQELIRCSVFLRDHSPALIISIRKGLYISLFRSHLSYGSQVW